MIKLKKLSEKGFTLVEMIVATALVGIIAVTFVPLLTTAFANIYSTGDKSQATYKASEQIEEKIDSVEKEVSQEVIDKNLNNEYTDVEIKFDGKTTIKSTVKKEEGSNNKNGQDTTIRVGVPIKVIEKKP